MNCFCFGKDKKRKENKVDKFYSHNENNKGDETIDTPELYIEKNINQQYRFKNKGNCNFYNKKKNELEEIQINERNTIKGIVGLSNLGCSCYLNSVLQNLKNVFPFTLYIMKNYKHFNKLGFTFNYCELVANLIYQTNNLFFEPSKFFCHLQKLSPNFRIGEQNDSSICIMYILNRLEKETNKIGVPNVNIIDSLSLEEKGKFKSFIYKSYTKRNSYVLDYFYGFQEDIYKCMNKNCKYTKYSYQGFTVLSLPIVRATNDSILNLKDALEYFQLGRLHKDKPGFDCSKCKKLNKIQSIMTKTVIISYPKILIINFKRIGERYFYNHNVYIPETLNLDKYKYELFGFIEHIGGANSGHNIAICKNFFDNKWYEYNDSKVKPIDKFINIDENKIPETKNGFLFIYKMIGVFENIETDQEKDFIFRASLALKNELIQYYK